MFSFMFSRICFITLHPIKAQSLCPGNRCRRPRGQQQLGTSTDQLGHPHITMFSLLIKGFFHDLCVSYSQKRHSGEDIGTTATTKKLPTTLPRRDARQIYNPPSGKYSASIGNFSYGECLIKPCAVVLYALLCVCV